MGLKRKALLVGLSIILVINILIWWIFFQVIANNDLPNIKKGISSLVSSAIMKDKFNSIVKGMRSESIDNVTIYYNEEDKTYISFIKSAIKVGETETDRIFGKSKAHPFNVVILPSNKAFAEAVDPDAVNGGFMDAQTIYVSKEKISYYSFLLVYVQYKTSEFCQTNGIDELDIPAWFRIGLAEYVTYPSYEAVINKKDVIKIKDFRSLNSSEELNEAQSEGYKVKTQSYMALKKLVDIKGEKVIRSLLLDSGKTDFYAAFKKDTAVNIEDFQKQLK